MDKLNLNVYENMKNRMSNNGFNSTDIFGHSEENESSLVKELKQYKQNMLDDYYKSILNPEVHIAKVPSRIPIETAIAPLKYQFNITPNLSGKFCLVVDPFAQSGYLYQSSSVDGVGGSGTLTSLTFAQDANIIDQWRLVSSSLILRYYGNFNTLSGYFVTAVTSNVNAATQTTYLTFNNVEDLQNKQVLRCADGLKLIYSPLDEKATDFAPQSQYSGNTHQCRWQYLFVVVGDAFPNVSCIRADYFRNIEYTSLPAFKEYINHSKAPPCELKLPEVIGQVNVAPRMFVREKPGIADLAADVAIQLGKEAFGQFLGGYTNPLNMKKFG